MRISLPLPTDMDVYLRYYIDWIVQFLACSAFYTLISTVFLFFVGMNLYILEMVDDLRVRMNDLNVEMDTIIQKIMIEINFHIGMLE